MPTHQDRSSPKPFLDCGDKMVLFSLYLLKILLGFLVYLVLMPGEQIQILVKFTLFRRLVLSALFTFPTLPGTRK